MEIILLSDQDVESLVSFEETMQLLEQAFADYQTGKSLVFPVVREVIKKYQGVFGIKSGYLETQEVLGFKAGGFWLNNMNKGLSNHQSAIMLFDPDTGQPRAVLAANFVTKLRTGVLGAISCKYMARPDSETIAIIGAGMQGRNQLEATLKVLPAIRRGYAYDIFPAAAEALARDFSTNGRVVTVAATAEEACRMADIIVTTSSNYKPIVMAEWVKPGTHINAVGTDTRGKQELDPQIFVRADKIVVDNMSQCLYLGECQHAFDAGLITEKSIHAELGEIIRGTKSARQTVAEITVFDTTGVAIQDLVTAGYALQQAVKLNIGVRVKI
ncbi:MAG: ornithine cyclodeaminase family protein [Veillonellaceae bacterium]|nr:ornithine cyclodeaminase family protein [Veillonellaceae bacterium]